MRRCLTAFLSLFLLLQSGWAALTPYLPHTNPAHTLPAHTATHPGATIAAPAVVAWEHAAHQHAHAHTHHSHSNSATDGWAADDRAAGDYPASASGDTSTDCHSHFCCVLVLPGTTGWPHVAPDTGLRTCGDLSALFSLPPARPERPNWSGLA